MLNVAVNLQSVALYWMTSAAYGLAETWWVGWMSSRRVLRSTKPVDDAPPPKTSGVFDVGTPSSSLTRTRTLPQEPASPGVIGPTPPHRPPPLEKRKKPKGHR